MPRLLHVSDIHFGPKHLPEPARGLRALIEREAPDVVVISGDLTQRAKPSQFRAAREFVEALPVPVVFVPGNHDVPLYRVWERACAPFGAWRRHFYPDLVRDSVSDELAVLGVNTAHGWTTKHGRIRPRELQGLEQRLERLRPGVVRVLVAHHPVAAAPELDGEPVARRSAGLLELARRHGVRLILAGHLHHGFAVPGSSQRPPVLHCGTTTSNRGRGSEIGKNSLHWIEIGDRSTRVERRLWDPERGRFVALESFRFEARGAAVQSVGGESAGSAAAR